MHQFDKPKLAYVSPFPETQGGFYYREQHANRLSDSFDLTDISESKLVYFEYDFAQYGLLLPFLVIIKPFFKFFFRLHEDYTNIRYGWFLRQWDNLWLMLCASLIIVHTRVHRQKLWKINQRKTEVLWSGMDIKERKTKPEENTIIIPGFISDWKGHDILLKALTEVRKEIPEIKLIIAGKIHSKAFFNDLSKYTYCHGLQDNIELHSEYLEKKQMQKLLARAKIAVLPYRRITFSAALLDCLDYEIPTIVSDIPEFKELAPGIPSFHVDCWEYNFDETNSPQPSPESCLRSKIINLLKDKKHYSDVKKRVVSLKKLYDWNKIVKREAELMEEI